MSLPIQIIFNYYHCNHENQIKEVPKQEFNPKNIKFNYNAKPYRRTDKNQNYNKGYYCNMNACNTRSFNGSSNRSYKSNK